MQFHPEKDQERPPSPDVARRRLEAFSDAVFAIAITLLALNLQVPVLTTVTPQALAATLAARWPTYLSFLLSFVTLLIAWVCSAAADRLYRDSQFHLQSALVRGGAARRNHLQGLASPHEHDSVLPRFPVLFGRGGTRLLESHRGPRHLWHVVGSVDHHATCARSRAVASSRCTRRARRRRFTSRAILAWRPSSPSWRAAVTAPRRQGHDHPAGDAARLVR